MRAIALTEEPTIRYRNTDLDLVASIPLDDLASALATLGVFPLHTTHGDDGRWYCALETDSEHYEPESDIIRMLRAIESLTGSAAKTWTACAKREFNVGYDCGDEPWAFNQGISNETLRRMGQCGATFRLTLYPHRVDGDAREEGGT